MSEDDPLEELYVDKADINKERLSEALSGLIGIDRDSGEAVMLPGYSGLSQTQKIYAYLLYRRVAFELGHLEEDGLGVSGSELSDATGVPKGTIQRVCPESPLIESDQSMGGYVIGEFAIAEAIDELEEE